jgi:hypothetical protein
MFSVTITPGAKLIIERDIAQIGSRTGLIIHRIGALADVSRAADGATVWSIERPPAWGCGVASLEGYSDADLLVINGIHVCLALIPKRNERGVVVSTRDGALIVADTDA